MSSRKAEFSSGGLLCLLVTSAAVLATGIAEESEKGHAAGTGAQCDIVAKEEGKTLRLQGVVIAEKMRRGNYEFEVHTLGGSGSSATRQSGQFSAGSGQPEYLGSVSFGSAAAEYDARLTLRFEDGKLVCSKRFGKGSAG